MIYYWPGPFGLMELHEPLKFRDREWRRPHQFTVFTLTDVCVWNSITMQWFIYRRSTFPKGQYTVISPDHHREN